MMPNKFSKSLQLYLEKAQPSTIEVIVELQTNSTYPTSSLTKQEKIKHIKRSFNDELETITHVLQNTGGKIIDTAWINKTVKLTIPVGGLGELAGIHSVENIDLPHQLKMD